MSLYRAPRRQNSPPPTRVPVPCIRSDREYSWAVGGVRKMSLLCATRSSKLTCPHPVPRPEHQVGRSELVGGDAKASLAQWWTDPCHMAATSAATSGSGHPCSPCESCMFSTSQLGRWGGSARGPLPFEAEGVSLPGARQVTMSLPQWYTTPEDHAEQAARLRRPDAVASLSSVRCRAGVDDHAPPESACPWTGVPPVLGRSGHVGAVRAHTHIHDGRAHTHDTTCAHTHTAHSTHRARTHSPHTHTHM
jgi:hypothetical protein